MNTQTSGLRYRVKLAQTPQEITAAKRLRYDVFVGEMGGDGEGIDHLARLEQDRFDAHCDHLLLIDPTDDAVVGVYRLMQSAQARANGGFYSETEYDLAALKSSGRALLELGRSCLHPAHRGGTGMHQLWKGLLEYVKQHRIELLFGVASFHGTEIATLAPALSLLHHNHLAPDPLRAVARGAQAQSMNLIPSEQLDRRAAMIQVPSLIKAYLRLGGKVGQGAYVDHAFNTTDVCLVLDIAAMPQLQNARHKT